MLKTLDILIGTVTVLLVFSMAVTVITQAITAILNRKGKHLRDGITNLLRQLGVSDINFAKTISEKILKHPMISVDGKLGHVIHREELMKLLLDLGSGQGAATLEGNAKKALEDALKQGGIADPAETLKNIHDMGQQIEASNPGIANYIRDGLAVLHGAPGEFVARLHSWFDQSIDRVSERFTQYTHAVVVGVSLVVVLFVQLDTIAVVQRLSIDDQFRATVVQSAVKDFSGDASKSGGSAENQTQAGDKNASTSSTAGTSTATDSKATPSSGSANAQALSGTSGKQTANSGTGNTAQPPSVNPTVSNSATAPNNGSPSNDRGKQVDPKPYYDLLNKTGLITIPDDGSFSNWWHQLQDGRKWPGMIISVLLLSLGAPFWYKALAQLLQLRSALAGKDDAQRQQRQGATPPGVGGGAAGAGSANADAGSTPNLPKGESGNLAAVG